MTEEDKTIPEGEAPPPNRQKPLPGEKTTIFHTRKNPSPDTNRIVVPPEVRVARGNPDLLLNQYVLVKKVGSGGMGSVWKAWDTRLARWVAVKFLDNANEVAIRRFEREAQLVAQLHHQNITGIHEINRAEDQHYLVMDFIDGEPIGREEIPLAKTLQAFVKICRAVHYAHDQSIIHRDIKPGNILLRRDGEPYVTDFGLGKALTTQSSLSVTGSVIGTPVFMSPEQAAGNHDAIDALSDVYSLGATLYALITGQAPFDSKNPSTILLEVATEEPRAPRKVDPDIPSQVEAITLKAMEKKKPDRYTSAEEMARDIERYLNEKSVIAKAPGPLRRTGRMIRRNPWPFASLFLLFVLGGILSFLFLRPEVNEQTDRKTNKSVDQNRVWNKNFKSIRTRISYFGYQNPSPKLIEQGHTLFQNTPKELLGETTAWFEKQLALPPQEVWPKEIWLDKQAEAKRIQVWSQTLLDILKETGDAFESIRTRLTDMNGRFSSVTLYRGSVTLKILVQPYARLEGMKSGETWVIENGTKKPGLIRVSGDDLYTPLVLSDLPIQPITMIFTHPQLGTWTVPLQTESLQNGTTYIYSATFQKPESVRLRPAP